MTQEKTDPGFVEFVALMGMMVALVALSIDAILPALADIGQDLGVQRDNTNQLIISLLLLGLGLGQIIYGPISDSIGRKPAIGAGFCLFIVGCALSLFAVSFPMFIAGRILQGVGVAGPRIVSIALIRDKYEGRSMARVMSFVMMVFILVPALGPALGQGILLIAEWRAIFVFYLLVTAIIIPWFFIRQPETLAPVDRIPFSLKRIGLTIREILTTRISFGYTMTAGLVFGAFIGYLNSAQQIFQDLYGLGKQFPLYFSVLALAIGCASFLNARLVMRYGMRALTTGSAQLLAGVSGGFFIVAYMFGGQPPLWLFMVCFMIMFFFSGIMFGNLNALAMEPLGHIAGIGAAVVGSLTTFISVLLSMVIGQLYNGTVLPLVGGFALLSIASIMVIRWTEAEEPISQYT